QRHLVGQLKKMRASWHEAERNHDNCKKAQRFEQHGSFRDEGQDYLFRAGFDTHPNVRFGPKADMPWHVGSYPNILRITTSASASKHRPWLSKIICGCHE